MDVRNFEEFMNFYFQSPSPERTAEAMQFYLAEVLLNYPDTVMPAAYLFGRLAQNNPELCSVYEELCNYDVEEEKLFVENILSGLNETPQKPINALERVVRKPSDNDLLWAEFSLTGDADSVIRLIDTLERSDKIRGKLNQWLELPENLVGRIFGMYRRRFAQFRNVIGIVCDDARQNILSNDDLDCLFLLHRGQMADQERFNNVSKAVPFLVETEEFIYMAVKATAKWSLTSRAAVNDIVLSTIEQEISKRQGSVRLALLEIAGTVRLGRNEPELARKWLQEFVLLNPTRTDIIARLSPIEIKDQLDDLVHLDAAVSETVSDAEVFESIARECTENGKTATSFFSRATLGIRKGSDYAAADDEPFIEWNGEYKSPSNFRVEQWMDPADWDAWISIGRQTYQNAGIWFKCENKIQKSALANINKLIQGIRWRKILAHETPVSSETKLFKGKRYQMLKYETGRLNSIFTRQFPIKIRMRSKSVEAILWLDVENKLLVKGEASLKNVQGEDGIYHFYFRQLFAGYNAPIEIEKPELMVAPIGMDMEPGSEVKLHTVPSESKLFDGGTKSE